MSRFEELVKRGFDVVVAIIGLFVLSPLFLLVSLAIKLESRGSALCRQTRYSLNGTTIEAFRFRSTSNQGSGTFNHMAIRVPRTTRVGHVLRHTGIGKLPQLINVLRGEMSIVGPCLYKTAPGKALRIQRQCNAKSGMVNWAHVSNYLEKDSSPSRHLQHRIDRDLYYIQHRSFWFDIKLILQVILSANSYK